MMLLTGGAAILHLCAPTAFLQVLTVTTIYASRELSVALVLLFLGGVSGVVNLVSSFSNVATSLLYSSPDVLLASSRATLWQCYIIYHWIVLLKVSHWRVEQALSR